MSVDVFCTGKYRVVKIAPSYSKMVLQVTKHTTVYPGSGPSLEVIALRPMILILKMNNGYNGAGQSA
jgi:hypothetical protein